MSGSIAKPGEIRGNFGPGVLIDLRSIDFSEALFTQQGFAL